MLINFGACPPSSSAVGGSPCWISFVAAVKRYDTFKEFLDHPTSPDYAAAFTSICSGCMRAAMRFGAASSGTTSCVVRDAASHITGNGPSQSSPDNFVSELIFYFLKK